MLFFGVKNFFKLSVLLVISLSLILGISCIKSASAHLADHGSAKTMQLVAQNIEPCCGLTTLQHFNSLTNTLLVTPHEIEKNLTFLIFSLILALCGLKKKLGQDCHDKKDPIFYKLYITNNPHLSLFNNLNFVLAQGILHPKIY